MKKEPAPSYRKTSAALRSAENGEPEKQVSGGRRVIRREGHCFFLYLKGRSYFWPKKKTKKEALMRVPALGREGETVLTG